MESRWRRRTGMSSGDGRAPAKPPKIAASRLKRPRRRGRSTRDGAPK
jgi:hypothetical protein